MCRMLAIVGNISAKSEYVRKFRELSEKGAVKENASPGHRDGWGILTYQDGLPRYLGRKPTAAMSDQDYESACEQIAVNKHPGILIAHLRKASCGKVSVDNTQPLVINRWSFSHNGTIWSPTLHHNPGESSDSFAAFRKMYDIITSDHPSTTPDGFTRLVSNLRIEISANPDNKGRTYSSLTFFLSDGKRVYALRDFNDKRDANYYTLYYMRKPDATVLCQEKIVQGDWKPLGNKELAVVESDGNLQIIPTD